MNLIYGLEKLNAVELTAWDGLGPHNATIDFYGLLILGAYPALHLFT